MKTGERAQRELDILFDELDQFKSTEVCRFTGTFLAALAASSVLAVITVAISEFFLKNDIHTSYEHAKYIYILSLSAIMIWCSALRIRRFYIDR